MILLGTMLFFSFAMTPAIFARLEPEQAARTVRALFPVYYLVIIICGGGGALVLALAEHPVPASLLAIIAGFAVLTRQFVIPQLDALREAKSAGDADATRQFKRQHGISMAVNPAQIVAAASIAFLFRSVTRATAEVRPFHSEQKENILRISTVSRETPLFPVQRTPADDSL